MTYAPCPGCGQQSPGTTRERHPNGYTKCDGCGYKTLSRLWDRSDKAEIHELEQKVAALEAENENLREAKRLACNEMIDRSRDCDEREDRANARVKELEAELAEAREEIDRRCTPEQLASEARKWGQAAERSREVLGQLRADLAKTKQSFEEERAKVSELIDRKNTDDPWLWMDDESEDDVATLACPVLMSADQVRALMGRLAAERERGKRLKDCHLMLTRIAKDIERGKPVRYEPDLIKSKAREWCGPFSPLRDAQPTEEGR